MTQPYLNMEIVIRYHAVKGDMDGVGGVGGVGVGGGGLGAMMLRVLAAKMTNSSASTLRHC